MRSLILTSSLVLAGCGVEPLSVRDLAPEDAYASATPAPASLRRLTAEQFERVVHDLLGDDVVVPRVTGPDPAVGGLKALGSATGGYSPRVVEGIEGAAFDLARQVVEDEGRRAALVPCAGEAAPDASCRRQALGALGRRAWRRPLTSAELDRVVAVADTAADVLGDGWGGWSFGVAALLQSPKFLFRTELGAEASGAGGLGPYALASRLSFLLWDTGPDDVLLDAAAAGDLDTREGLLVQAQRMLDDPRAREGIRAIFDDAWGLYELEDDLKDPTLHEHAHPELGVDAREETLRLLEHLVLDVDDDIRTLMTTRETFLNPRMATLYGVPAPDPEDWRLVEMPEAARRAGFLTQASFLQRNAHATASSATLRGKAVRTRLLCQEIPNPPVDVDTSIPEPSGTTRTLRERVKEHLENPSCSACHQLTDPIGLGLENYDAVGRWRTTDNGATIDPTGDLDDVVFADALALGQVVADHPDFTPCIVRTLARNARGQVTTTTEEAWIDTLATRFADHDHRVRPLLLELVTSPMFRRAGPAAAGEVE